MNYDCLWDFNEWVWYTNIPWWYVPCFPSSQSDLYVKENRWKDWVRVLLRVSKCHESSSHWQFDPSIKSHKQAKKQAATYQQELSLWKIGSHWYLFQNWQRRAYRVDCACVKSSRLETMVRKYSIFRYHFDWESRPLVSWIPIIIKWEGKRQQNRSHIVKFGNA